MHCCFVEKQQEAMTTFMGISADFCVRKFFMDNNQKAYISVDTLLIYVMVYPQCPAFKQARLQTISYLTVSISLLLLLSVAVHCS